MSNPQPDDDMPDDETPTQDGPETAEALRQQLAAANARLAQAELRTHAVRAGIIDLDCLRLLDPAGLTLDAAGNLPQAEAMLAALKRDKPWAFAKANSSHPAPAPAPEPPKLRKATDMSHSEWQAARDRLIRRR